jgi:ribosome biogenesis GTPase
MPELDIRVGALSEASGEGTHTTTSSNLYHLPSGGQIIDSPGVRDFGLWNTTADDILHGFIELREYIGHCKFSNCSHQQEPDCAIQQALSENKISEQRFSHYLKMIEEYVE